MSRLSAISSQYQTRTKNELLCIDSNNILATEEGNNHLVPIIIFLLFQARHQTAQLQFDNFCENLLSAPNANAAFLAGHSATMQNTAYTDDEKKRVLLGYLELRRLEENEKKSDARSFNLEMAKIKIAK